MKREDFEGSPCSCVPCREAGVSDKPIIRDYYSGRWMHGRELRRWHEEKAKFQARMAALKVKGMG